MSWLSRVWFALCRLMSALLIRGIEPKILQIDDGTIEDIADKPVCYVLREHSWTDRFVLERLLKKQGLPVLGGKPGVLPTVEQATCLYLPILQGRRGGERGRKAMEAYVQEAVETGLPIQVVPVSLFWGRDPGSETSIFRLLVGSSESAGAIRKLLIILAQRGNLVVHIAKPVSFEKLVAHTREPAQAATLLARTLSFYFTRRKTATLGPSLLSRQQITDAVIRRQPVQEVMAKLAAEPEANAAKIEKQARKMANEIAANFDSRLLRVLEMTLTWVFQKLFTGLKVYHNQRLRDLASHRQLVYMPSHRSHFDYLLISYALYKEGLVPPHIAAGVNLNFWPVGGLLRRGGAFYIRRSFAGQELYSAVFHSYLDVILGRGYSMEFYPEGGRSRTGRLLPPKKGMLKMTLESLVQQPARKVAIVPIYVCYDKLVEGATYAKELRGSTKQKESASGLLKARKIFKSSYGSPHVSFGEPILVDEALARIEPAWRRQFAEGNHGFLQKAIDQIAQQNMEHINAAAVVNPIGLVSTILLSSPQRAMAEDELLAQIDAFIQLLKLMPYSRDVSLPEGTSREILDFAARTAGLSRIDHSWGAIITATGKEAVMLTYYRNSIMHVLALPSLIARFFRHQQRVNEQALLDSCLPLYPFLRKELFLPELAQGETNRVQNQIDALVSLGLLVREGSDLLRPEVGTEAYSILIGLGRILRETFERYTMSSLVLAQKLGVGELPSSRSELEKYIIEMAQRLAILSGREAPEYFDKTLFRGFLDTLISENLLHITSAEGEDRIEVDDRLQSYAHNWVALLGPDVQQSMLQLLRRAPSPE
ncbi:glycerol-3-phosphate 1-O-acyltransferase PlsB [Spongiibacter sp. KMU-158]|uniref:Glycerol-3-phosphate acyltransferase n=1 Tax=Spongiibacter pelagi TaxID=2760804 RepID=A0A927BZB4_9GAMM|nr:glycerol-3-phosphate 1-O-acyltransferase PlsB [Spongiibacter pelagi]MBD2858358.1 glycerol-3-phosphate 1-O-acyltransferase PlsB [Spongiibacter pelagi]